jgi:hypothetical protein
LQLIAEVRQRTLTTVESTLVEDADLWACPITVAGSPRIVEIREKSP